MGAKGEARESSVSPLGHAAPLGEIALGAPARGTRFLKVLKFQAVKTGARRAVLPA
jgi:hypothetical protein